MNKLLLIPAAVIALSFAPLDELGFGDIFIESADTRSYTIQKGNHVTCQTVVTVGGFSGPVPSFKVGYYLSDDTTITVTDKLIKDFTVTHGGGSFASYTCQVKNVDLGPLGVSNGTYYIGTIVDVDNTVAENGMTPEIANNSWAYRSAAGVMNVVKYPGSDVGISENAAQTPFYNISRAAGSITYSSATAEKITVQLFSIDGRLLASGEGSSVSIPLTNELCLVRVSSGTRVHSVKAVH